MIRLELLQKLFLLLLITGQATRLLLALVVHHLLDHGAGLTIEVTQTRVLRRNLGDIDLGGAFDDMRPPLHLVYLVKMNDDFLARRIGGCFKGPGGFVDKNGVGEITLREHKKNICVSQ